ncbi:MAG: hypothetical protein ABI668_14350 [Sphingorhabdus sp.]
MILSRRSLIKTGVVATAIATTTARVLAAPQPALVIYDSRLPQSSAFARVWRTRKIDVAHEDARFWRALRTVSRDGAILGITSWSDWVIVRGLLEEKGMRVKQEAASGTLFRWTMA